MVAYGLVDWLGIVSCVFGVLMTVVAVTLGDWGGE